MDRVKVTLELGKEPVQPEVSLQEAVTALGADYRLYPVWGQDSNVNELLQAALAAKGCADVQCIRCALIFLADGNHCIV